MVEPDGRQPRLHSPGGALGDLVAQFERLAQAIQERSSEASLAELLRDSEQSCQRAAKEQTGETKTLLMNVATAVQTWRQVWPRLGSQSEFRLAVAREAELWSKRLQALGTSR